MAAGSYISGTWQETDKGWIHVDVEGVRSTGWIHKESGWYYLDPITGIMKTGWLKDVDGQWYYFETLEDVNRGKGAIEGRLHSGWLEDKNGSSYFMNTAHNGSFGARLTGWQWIEGSCYYFDPAEGADNGKMYKGAVTPDGFIVDVQGRWVDKDGTVRHDKQGLSATETEEAASRIGKSSTDLSLIHI